MIRDLFIKQLAEFGADEKVADRLLLFNEKPYVAWLAFKYVYAGRGTLSSLEEFARIMDIPFTQANNAFHRAKRSERSRPDKNTDYPVIMAVLNRYLPNITLWVSLSFYAYNNLRKLAIELLVDEGFDVASICKHVNVKKSTVYKIRNEYTARYIQQKGDLT